MELLQLQEVGADNTVLCMQFGKNDIKHGRSSKQAKSRLFIDKKQMYSFSGDATDPPADDSATTVAVEDPTTTTTTTTTAAAGDNL